MFFFFMNNIKMFHTNKSSLNHASFTQNFFKKRSYLPHLLCCWQKIWPGILEQIGYPGSEFVKKDDKHWVFSLILQCSLFLEEVQELLGQAVDNKELFHIECLSRHHENKCLPVDLWKNRKNTSALKDSIYILLII